MPGRKITQEIEARVGIDGLDELDKLIESIKKTENYSDKYLKGEKSRSKDLIASIREVSAARRKAEEILGKFHRSNQVLSKARQRLSGTNIAQAKSIAKNTKAELALLRAQKSGVKAARDRATQQVKNKALLVQSSKDIRAQNNLFQQMWADYKRALSAQTQFYQKSKQFGKGLPKQVKETALVVRDYHGALQRVNKSQALVKASTDGASKALQKYNAAQKKTNNASRQLIVVNKNIARSTEANTAASKKNAANLLRENQARRKLFLSLKASLLTVEKQGVKLGKNLVNLKVAFLVVRAEVRDYNKNLLKSAQAVKVFAKATKTGSTATKALKRAVDVTDTSAKKTGSTFKGLRKQIAGYNSAMKESHKASRDTIAYNKKLAMSTKEYEKLLRRIRLVTKIFRFLNKLKRSGPKTIEELAGPKILKDPKQFARFGKIIEETRRPVKRFEKAMRDFTDSMIVARSNMSKLSKATFAAQRVFAKLKGALDIAYKGFSLLVNAARSAKAVS